MLERFRSPALACLLLALGCGASPSDPSRTLVWADEFDGTAGSLPDAGNWRFDIGTDWGNAQLEYDTNRPENASLDGNGNLVITARRESFQGREYTSARITTETLRGFQYGRIEARIKLPVGQGIWPAFWMLGDNFRTVGWPQCGEIDIMEFRGQLPSIVAGTIHGPGYSAGNGISRTYTLPNGRRFDDDFHVFAVEWSREQIEWFVDDVPYLRIQRDFVPTTWVFDQTFHIILNVAVGGGYVGAPDGTTVFPQQMLVDYVRVYR